MEQQERVVTYIVRNDHLVVLVHENDANPLLESGLQVPGGTIEPGEAPADAALREAREETGLEGLRIVGYLGDDVVDARPIENVRIHRHFFQLAVDGDTPTEWRHVEANASDGGTYPFRLFWLPLTKAPLLAGGMSALVGRMFDTGDARKH